MNTITDKNYQESIKFLKTDEARTIIEKIAENATIDSVRRGVDRRDFKKGGRK